MNDETPKQRLERIAVAILAGQGLSGRNTESAATWAIEQAKELIKQLDALPIDE